LDRALLNSIESAEMKKSDDTNNNPTEEERPLWGAAAIGQVINRNPRQTHHLLASGCIKSARKVGGRWTAIPAALRAEFGSGETA
jgi:hypothetical protein